MLFGLALEARFETASAGINDKDREVSLAGAGNHVGDKVSVARGIENGKSCLLGFKFVGGNVNCDASDSFLGALIQDPCKGKGRLAYTFRLFSVFFDCPLVYDFEIVKEASHKGAFPGVDMTYQI